MKPNLRQQIRPLQTRSRNPIRFCLVRIRLVLAFFAVLLCGGTGCHRPPEDESANAPLAASDNLADTGSSTDAMNNQPAARAQLFLDRTAKAGLQHAHFSGTTGGFLFAEILGSGAAFLDYDGDGDLDLYVLQGTMLDPDASPDDALFPAPEDQPKGNRLFKNLLVESGELKFVDATQQAGLTWVTYGMGAATGDYDNDGDVDLYVTAFRNNRMYQNNGDGTFTDVTEETGTDAPDWSTSASFCDLDKDGDLDLYVVSYVAYSVDKDVICTSASGNRDYCGPQNYSYSRDYCFENNGDGTFTDITDSSGVALVRGPGLGVTCADFDGNGWIDLFVANDGEANYAWMNFGEQPLKEMGMMSGTALNRDGTPEASMGITAGDFDGDGDVDLFMTHLINETNTLYKNNGKGAFTDATDGAGLGAASRSMTGFGSAWFDYDNDGWLDLYIGNGDVKVEEMRSDRSEYPFDQPNQLFHNRGNGRFELADKDGGDATAGSYISRGVAFGDVDNDGDTDFIVTNNSGPLQLMINAHGNENSWLRLKLVGTKCNRDAYGTRVVVLREGKPPLWRRVLTDGSYLCAHDSRLLIGLGDSSRVPTLGVVWADGSIEKWTDVASNQQLELVQGQGQPWTPEELP